MFIDNLKKVFTVNRHSVINTGEYKALIICGKNKYVSHISEYDWYFRNYINSNQLYYILIHTCLIPNKTYIYYYTPISVAVLNIS